ncbi:MAG: substrate-binding domain-containing protein [Thermodesulfobacteriota bacterium]
MKKLFAPLLVVVLTLPLLAVPALAGDTITISTTTSTENSGLLSFLLPEFTKDTGVAVKVIAKGTGAALRDGMDGNVDAVFVHDTAREIRFVEESYGSMRFAVMHNDFVIVGPASDPAGIKSARSAAEALKRIAASGSSFVSRGDDSGTHSKEQALWKEAGLALATNKSMMNSKEITSVSPADMKERYLSIGQGMGKTLSFADEKLAYTIADRGTYIQMKYGNGAKLDLVVLCENDPALFNPYGVIPVNPKKFSHVKEKAAMDFCMWLTSPKGQKMIRDYTVEGKPLFFPDVVTTFAP